jgi:drug/metabolite transporter (DMT)-like permease
LSQRRETPWGPWLVALGAGLWGTESAWRIPLNDLFPDADVLVFWEHVILVACALPLILPRLGELKNIRARTFAWLVFSGVAGSAVGAILFTLAIKHGNPTVANVVLNVQPVLSTTAAFFLLRERLAKSFYPWAALAVIAGMALVLEPGTEVRLDEGTSYALGCAFFWGLSTVAGRIVMTEISLPLAAGLRVVIGLVCMTLIVLVRGPSLWPPEASAHTSTAIVWLVLLATLSGGIPLLIYFAGLARTKASTAGYFEMMQTLVAVVITWGVFHAALDVTQVIGAIVLVAAVAMVQRAQATIVDQGA